MKVIELLENGGINLSLSSENKDDVIKELTELLVAAESVGDADLFINDIYAREKLSSTAIGNGVMIPHAKSLGVLRPAIVFGRSLKGIDCNALDNKDIHLFFMIACSAEQEKLHLEALVKLARKLINEEFKKKLTNAISTTEIKNLFKEVN